MQALVEVYPTADRLADAAAHRIADRARQAAAAHGRFTLALAGGHTPRATYARLAEPDVRDTVPWSKVHVFWTDERPVGPSHDDSNFRMAREALLDRVPVPPANVHRVPAELGPEPAADAYTAELAAVLGGAALDLVVLGLGADGHIASLFPGGSALDAHGRGAQAGFAPSVGQWRVSLAMDELAAAHEVLALVTGAAKGPAVAGIRRGRADTPGGRLSAVNPSVHWALDRAAADAALAEAAVADSALADPAMAGAGASRPAGVSGSAAAGRASDRFGPHKRAAAEAAALAVPAGTRLGLGTGSTAGIVVAAVGRRLRDGTLSDIVAVATSEATARIARECGVPLAEPGALWALDLAIDGADEIAPDLSAVKGLGGALVREKIVARMARRFVLVSDAAKLVARLGTRAPLPVAVLPFGWQGHAAALHELGAVATLRRQADGTPFVSDDGLYMLDARFAEGLADPVALEAALCARPGVVETGLFMAMADAAYVADGCGAMLFQR